MNSSTKTRWVARACLSPEAVYSFGTFKTSQRSKSYQLAALLGAELGGEEEEDEEAKKYEESRAPRNPRSCRLQTHD
jgi:hypothetical protein